MPAFGQIAKSSALIFAAATILGFSSAARAETGWLWFDSVFAAPHAAPASTSRQLVAPIKRTKLVHPIAAHAPAPRLISVSAAPDARPDCFWCGRPVYVAGLSF